MNIFKSIYDKIKKFFKRKPLIKIEYVIVPVKEPEHAKFRVQRPSTPKGTREVKTIYLSK